MAPRPSALLIGDWQRPAFRTARQQLDQVLPAVAAPDGPRALQMLGLQPESSLLLIAQSYPGQFALREVQQWQAAAPLARLCVVLDSWCEGESRSGRPWPGVARVYTHQLWARLRSEDWPGATPAPRAAWSMLPTIGADELWLRRAQQPLPRFSGLAVVCSARSENRATLVEVCRAVGLGTRDLHPAEPVPNVGAALVLYDADPIRTRRAEQLRTLVSRCHPAAVIGLIDFPRREEIEEAVAAGCQRVLAKPYLLDDLIACVQDALVRPNPVC